MRTFINLNKGWTFTKEGVSSQVDVPHTWNGIDGQDGGNDYKRLVCSYARKVARPDIMTDEDDAYLEFKGVNSSCTVSFNGKKVCEHHGGYSKFRVRVTDLMKEDNELVVLADNRKNETVYPQKADFTFYGGIYRDVSLIVVNKNHFDLDWFGGPGIKVTPVVSGKDGKVTTEAFVTGAGDVKVTVYDDGGKVVASGANGEELTVTGVRLWNGRIDPYMYTVKAELSVGGKVVDEVSANIGFRSFEIDPDKGFILNGKPYPLRGVCRHQDRPRIGNALTREMHEEDMALICDVGATTIRLAHYQHDDYFYDLCDKAGMVVWATAFDLYANDLSGGEYSYHGTPADYDKLEFMFYTKDPAFASSLRATGLRADALCLPIPKELAIEAPTDVSLLLACRRLGDPNDTYTYLNKSGVSLRILPVGETLGKARGDVPVGWLALHFPEVPEEDLPAHADEDSDGDGYANWEEYVLGTDPTDPSSTLRITSITPVSGAPAEVTWTREPGRVYTLLGTESLESPRWVPPTERSRFFKVLVEIAN